MSRKRLPEPRAFAVWSDRAERMLRRGACILFVTVLLFQSALQIPAFRSWLSSADHLEGIHYKRSSG